MSDNKDTNDTDLKKEVYNDVLHPALSTVGKTLEGVVKLALAPVSAFVWGYEKISAFLGKSIPEYFRKRKIAKEKVQTPDPAVAVPVLIAMTYTSNKEEIRNMFVNLLGASMNADCIDTHPCFVEIIKQLSSDECRMLRYLHLDPKMPMMKYRCKVDDKGGEMDLTPYFSDICLRANCEFLQKFPEYLDNLHRLGLVEVYYDRHLTDDIFYDELKQTPLFSEFQNFYHIKNVDAIERKSFYELTEFGKRFCSVCMD